MPLHELSFSGFRNLGPSKLTPALRTNLFYGENGAGKTSVLEAIHTLSLGRSFRTTSFQKVINYELSDAVVSGVFSGFASSNSSPIRIGVQRTKLGEVTAKAGGENLATVGELARYIPLQLLEPHSFQLLEGSPKLRRSFMDWGVFHVKHEFHSLWIRYQRCLKQRNTVLKRGKMGGLSAVSQLEVWDTELVTLAEQIDQVRQEYLAAFRPHFDKVCEQLIDFGSVELGYFKGWAKDQPFAEVLKEDQYKDQEIGYTRKGPHRADLRLKLEGRAVQEILSRGQTKMLVFALKLAQIETVSALAERKPLVLIDDLPSELDGDHRQKVADLLYHSGVQLFVTGVARDSLEDHWPEGECKVFHVEHGAVSEVFHRTE
ncbi:MAG: DNA replication/repair protein RecF [Cellvibrionaceae bacterium]